MIKKSIRNTGILILCWVLVMIIYFISYGVQQPILMLQLILIPSVFFAVIAFIFTFIEVNTSALRNLSIGFIIPAILIDQAIKVYLFSLNWGEIDVAVIEPAFHFNPSHNTLGSYLWVLLDWQGASNLLNVVLVVLLVPFFVEFWRFYRSERRNSLWINLFVNLMLAGALCNISDNLFHGGSLDYLSLKPLYTTDLKDIYISFALMVMIIEVFDNKLYRKDSNVSKDFNQYLYDDLKKLYGRIRGKS